MICPTHCPLCKSILSRRGSVSVETPHESKTIEDSFQCPNVDYACSNLNPELSWLGASYSELFVVGTHEEMFQTGCIAIRVFYLHDNYLTHQIDLRFIHKRPFKLGVKLNDEDFIRVFSRDDLHPLLEKIEKYSVFS
jgi:hypothetical protein